ncbi:peptidase S41, partial [bacterium]|nr:peptidase S41 [bacterium]
VQDGGGVLPDVEIAAVKANELTTALLNNNVVFDYATEYYYKNKVSAIDEFKFTDSDFADFTNFVSNSDFSFETKAEAAIKTAMADKENVVFDQTVENDFKKLLTDIEKSKLAALKNHQNEIQKKLEDEIVKRYFYREGLYEFYLTNDEAILAATELLANENGYMQILK